MKYQKSTRFFGVVLFMSLFILIWEKCSKKEQTVDQVSGKWKVLSIDEENALTTLDLNIDPNNVPLIDFTPDMRLNLNIRKQIHKSYFSKVKPGTFVYIDKSGFYIDQNFSFMAPQLDHLHWSAYVREGEIIYEGVLELPLPIKEMIMDEYKQRFIPVGLKDNYLATATPIFVDNSLPQTLVLKQQARFAYQMQSESRMVITGTILKYQYDLDRNRGKMAYFLDSTASTGFVLRLQKEP